MSPFTGISSTPAAAVNRRDTWRFNGTRRAKVSEQVKARGEACYFCHRRIDLAVRYPDPASFTVHHIKPRALYPHLIWSPFNLAAAHLSCNRMSMADPRVAGTATPGATSEPW